MNFKSLLYMTGKEIYWNSKFYKKNCNHLVFIFLYKTSTQFAHVVSETQHSIKWTIAARAST